MPKFVIYYPDVKKYMGRLVNSLKVEDAQRFNTRAEALAFGKRVIITKLWEVKQV